jgi:hypothetical protein
VNTRKSLCELGPLGELNVVREKNGITVVRKSTFGGAKSVSFYLTDNAIEVRDNISGKKFDVTPTLSDDGNCRVMVNGRECELWHVRKRALEELFFHKL